MLVVQLHPFDVIVFCVLKVSTLFRFNRSSSRGGGSSRTIERATTLVTAAFLGSSGTSWRRGGSGGCRAGRQRARTSFGLILLPLHAPVLEPDLDVTLREVQHGGQLDAARSGDVLVEVELLLQLQQLSARVGRARALVLVFQRELGPCSKTHRENIVIYFFN